MSRYNDSLMSDKSLPDEIQSYKPISPTAALSLLLSLAAVVAAISVIDGSLDWMFAAVPLAAIFLSLRGLSSIKKYDMAGKFAAKLALGLSALSLIGGIGAYIYYLKTAIPPGYQEISYDPLQTAAPESPGSTAKALDGKKVFIRGYVYPSDEMSRSKNGVKSFVLCRDNGTCCFGGQPKLNDMVEVKLKDPLTLHYTSSQHGVGGTFRVKSEQGEGKLGTIVYHIDDADVLH